MQNILRGSCTRPDIVVYGHATVIKDIHVKMADAIASNIVPVAGEAGIFSHLLGNVDGLVYRCLIDNNWTMQFISEGCVALTGYATEDFIANNPDLFPK